jgi:hypothetical protein
MVSVRACVCMCVSLYFLDLCLSKCVFWVCLVVCVGVRMFVCVWVGGMFVSYYFVRVGVLKLYHE